MLLQRALPPAALHHGACQVSRLKPLARRHLLHHPLLLGAPLAAVSSRAALTVCRRLRGGGRRLWGGGRRLCSRLQILLLHLWCCPLLWLLRLLRLLRCGRRLLHSGRRLLGQQPPSAGASAALGGVGEAAGEEEAGAKVAGRQRQVTGRRVNVPPCGAGTWWKGGREGRSKWQVKLELRPFWQPSAKATPQALKARN